MEKLVYLLRDGSGRAGSEIRGQLTEETLPKLRAAGAGRVRINLDDEEVAAGDKVRIQASPLPLRAVTSSQAIPYLRWGTASKSWETWAQGCI